MKQNAVQFHPRRPTDDIFLNNNVQHFSKSVEHTNDSEEKKYIDLPKFLIIYTKKIDYPVSEMKVTAFSSLGFEMVTV